MKTSTLFTAIVAVGLFATHAQAQSGSTGDNAGPPAHGATQAGPAAATATNAADGAAPAASDASAHVSAQGDAAADALARRYAGAAGSVDAAADIVGDLHAGSGDHPALAYGEIDATLALASQLVADNEAANLGAAVDAVLDLRADGLGWGQVAQELGYTVGSAASAAHAAGAQAGDAAQGAVASAVRDVSATTSGLSLAKQAGIGGSTAQGSVAIGTGSPAPTAT
ncbi:MAG TPA: hypothetical protein VFF91_05540, partial [Pseudoxanthomonas sp.]|nr:hypothetical protein [Pseudoxanthomonas sp.]